MTTPENKRKSASRVSRQGTQTTGRGRTMKRAGRGEGGQPGNTNARKSLPWLSTYSLSTAGDVARFLREVVRHVWTGELGCRQGGVLNSACDILLKHDEDLTRLREMELIIVNLTKEQQELRVMLDRLEEADRLRNRGRTKIDQRLRELSPRKEQAS